MELHQISPWCDSKVHAAREEVFIAAIKLQRAFIDAAAKPLCHNLGILMQNFGGRVDNSEVKGFLADLWLSLFLVIPCISTTFASVDSMLKDLPANSLGWLLIDEAVQALPQAAVGAIMRAQRIIVTGDPMQIEPVVMLSNSLTRNICQQFVVDPNYFNAPEASVQTLADAATPYFSEFHHQYGARLVGFPLLVHRRCTEPMFSISNSIAYESLMVNAKKQGSSPIRDCLGPSFWFDIQGEALDKWCPAEGEKVLELLIKLQQSAIDLNLYIVTPFRIVAGNLRQIIRNSAILKPWRNIEPDTWIYERIGTVHTVQGREAKAVILVLGAPAVEQEGARMWAGKLPNLLNVAVTRAKEVIYVIGNKSLWQDAGVFKELHGAM